MCGNKKTAIVRNIFVIFSCIVLSLNLTAQNLGVVYDDVTSKFSIKLAEELFNQTNDIKRVANKDTVLVQISKIDNIDGQQTKNSYELGYRISHYLQKSLNTTQFVNVFFLISSPYTQNHSPSLPQNISNDYDFFITGEYFFDADNIHFSKFKMSHFNSNYAYSFNDYNFQNDSLDYIKQIETDLYVKDNFERFVDITKTSNIIENITLTNNGTEVNSSFIDRIGKVYNINYDTDYDVSVSLKKKAFLYVFYFDPGDAQHHYLQVISPKNSGQNVQLNKGLNDAVLPSYLFFTKTSQSAEYHYVKFVVSEQKLDILKFYQNDPNIAADFYYIDDANSEKLINLINILDGIETFTFLLTIK